MIKNILVLVFGIFMMLTVRSDDFSTDLKSYIDKQCRVNCVDVETLRDAVSMASNAYNIDPKWILALIKVESRFSLSARNGSSVGLTQVHLKYHRPLFKDKDPKLPFDNIFIGSGILKDCIDKMNRPIINKKGKRKKNQDKGLDGVMKCYNGGGNKKYPTLIRQALSEVSRIAL